MECLKQKQSSLLTVTLHNSLDLIFLHVWHYKFFCVFITGGLLDVLCFSLNLFLKHFDKFKNLFLTLVGFFIEVNLEGLIVIF